MEIYEALKVAIEALRKRGIMTQADYRMTASRVNEEWVFWFVFLPETPGTDVTAIVDDQGNVRTLAGI
jgi:hypothetical protein